MSIRFAPASCSAYHLPLLLRGDGLAHWRNRRAANDNAATRAQAAFDPVLVAALRHFARDGFNAARTAEAAAGAALAVADSAGFAHWLGVTRQLDRRRAHELQRAAHQQAE